MMKTPLSVSFHCCLYKHAYASIQGYRSCYAWES